jgi:hypothetical protein
MLEDGSISANLVAETNLCLSVEQSLSIHTAFSSNAQHEAGKFDIIQIFYSILMPVIVPVTTLHGVTEGSQWNALGDVSGNISHNPLSNYAPRLPSTLHHDAPSELTQFALEMTDSFIDGYKQYHMQNVLDNSKQVEEAKVKQAIPSSSSSSSADVGKENPLTKTSSRHIDDPETPSKGEAAASFAITSIPSYTPNTQVVDGLPAPATTATAVVDPAVTMRDGHNPNGQSSRPSSPVTIATPASDMEQSPPRCQSSHSSSSAMHAGGKATLKKKRKRVTDTRDDTSNSKQYKLSGAVQKKKRCSKCIHPSYLGPLSFKDQLLAFYATINSFQLK